VNSHGDIYKFPPSARVSGLVKRSSVMRPSIESFRCSDTASPKSRIQHRRSAISQNRHTTATESSLQAFNLLSWTLTLCILRFFQSQWFLKKFAPREKGSRPREMRRLVWESFFAKWKTICELPKPRSVANWDSVCVPAAGRQSWLRPISTASLIVPSADRFRTSKQRKWRDG
jgi:hypothetical protein